MCKLYAVRCKIKLGVNKRIRGYSFYLYMVISFLNYTKVYVSGNIFLSNFPTKQIGII